MQGFKGDIDGKKTDFLTQWEKLGVGGFERITLKHEHYHM